MNEEQQERKNHMSIPRQIKSPFFLVLCLCENREDTTMAEHGI
jgi:hypothetical protein